MITLAALSVLVLCGSACLIVLLIVGYREQVRRATEAANRNAGYWAEAEAKRYEAELIVVQLDAGLKSETKRADELSRIAGDALRIAHHKEFSPKPDDFEAAKKLLGQRGYPPDEWPEVFD